MELSLDTKTTKLGVLRSRRTFVIDDMAWDNLMTSYSTASPAKSRTVERQLTSKYHRLFIKSGQIVMARPASAGGGCSCGCSPGGGACACGCTPAGLSAMVAWYPDKSALKVKIQVADAHFASCSTEDINQGQAYIIIQASAPGSKGKTDAFEVVPTGTSGKAVVYGKKDATATWKKTKTGYDAEVTVPWNRIVGFKQGMKLLPVQVDVNSRTSDGTSKSATTGRADEAGARAFVVLKLKK